MNKILESVKNFAEIAHGNQRRKYEDAKYIVHPLRVMETCRTVTDEISILSAALLHDVLEDTPVSAEEMLAFLRTVMEEHKANQTLQLVIELTDVYTKAAFPTYNRRKRKNLELERIAKTSAESQTIKYADIIDNTPGISKNDPDFAVRFLKEYKQLLKKTDKGHPLLYQRAVHLV